MAFPPNPGGSGSNATIVRIQDVVGSPPAAYNVVEEAEGVLKLAAEGAAVAGTATYGGAILEGASTIAAALSSFFDLPFIVVFVIVLVLLRMTEGIIIKIASNTPMAGYWLGPWTRTAFKFLDRIENAIIDFVRNSLEHLLHAMGQLTLILLELEGIDLQGILRSNPTRSTSTVTQAEISRLQHEINVINAEIRSIDYRISPIGTPLGGSAPAPAPAPVSPTQPTTYTVKVPQNLWDQIHHLEGQVSVIHQDMVHFNDQLERVRSEAHQTAEEMSKLSSEIHAVRAVAAGWQDIQQDLEDLGNQVDHFVSATTADLNHQSESLAQLAPLGLLVQPGIKGLKTLRQLEDTPCMCPKLPNIPRLQPELLAMYEFLTYG